MIKKFTKKEVGFSVKCDGEKKYVLKKEDPACNHGAHMQGKKGTPDEKRKFKNLLMKAGWELEKNNYTLCPQCVSVKKGSPNKLAEQDIISPKEMEEEEMQKPPPAPSGVTTGRVPCDVENKSAKPSNIHTMAVTPRKEETPPDYPNSVGAVSRSGKLGYQPPSPDEDTGQQ